MKKLIIILAIVFLATTAGAANISWTHDGVNTLGYTIYFWQTVDPSNVYNVSVGVSERSVVVDDKYFAPGVEYSFNGEAYNAVGTSIKSDSAKWTRPGVSYTPPADGLPTVIHLEPTKLTIIIE